MSWELKKYFPIFKNQPNLVYLDSAATAQKPQVVIDRISKFYSEGNANIKRGLYRISEQASQDYESARGTIADFFGAQAEELIFTKNATEALNLIAYSYAENFLKKGDEILLTEMEHHSNLLPWQKIAREKGLRLKFIKVNPDSGQLKLDQLDQLISEKTKIFSLTHASNVLGAVNNLNEIVRRFRQLGKGIVVGDLAQSSPHLPINFQELDLDFAALSMHKLYGPFGVGILLGKKDLLTTLPPFLTGGGVIESVSKDSSNLLIGPERFEAGTQNIADIIASTKACEFIKKISWPKVLADEKKLTAYALKSLLALPEVIIYGDHENKNRIGVIAFNLKDIHAHDVAQSLADENICLRAGHHCAMILNKEVLQVPATCRISLGIYNSEEDIDKLVEGLEKTVERFR